MHPRCASLRSLVQPIALMYKKPALSDRLLVHRGDSICTLLDDPIRGLIRRVASFSIPFDSNDLLLCSKNVP